MDWTTPEEITGLIAKIDAFIADEIKPLEAAHPQFFDHRREHFRTDWENDGYPHPAWTELLDEMRRRADNAGIYRFGLPIDLGGQAGSNLAMAMIREHLTAIGPGLHFPYADEASIVGNLPLALVLFQFGTPAQKERYLYPYVAGEIEIAFGLTEPKHGSDATYLETTARPEGTDWVINGVKRFNSLANVAAVDLVFARTSGQPGKAAGITAFLVPTNSFGFEVPFNHWTYNMPSDHCEVKLTEVRVPAEAVLGEVGAGLDCAQLFVHENRIRQAASSLGAAAFCTERSVRYSQSRSVFGKQLRDYQGIQWQLVELLTDVEFLRNTIYKVAWLMDQGGRTSVSDKVAMVNYRANQLACQAADRAIQVHGGMGYTRALPFEHIFRHHRRYRITEGSDELQMRRIAAVAFGFGSK